MALFPAWSQLTIAAASLVELLKQRAATQPERSAYIYLPDRHGVASTLSFSELLDRVETVAARLVQRAQLGDRAVLLCPHGLDFIIGFFACLVARIIAVPMMLPRRQSTHDVATAIIADCAPRFALTTRGLINHSRPDLIDRFRSTGMEWVFVDDDVDGAVAQPAALPKAEDIAFLQYTSGSTASPKGVMVSHANVLANLEMIRIALDNSERSTYVSWLPLYHDMGLIANVLQSLYIGALCVLLSPAGFIKRPLIWLRTIHDYRGEVAGAPNFAFDLCVNRYRQEDMADIDLSCWEFAYNAAEPVRAETLERFTQTFAPHGFSARAMRPSYGLAETTVLVSTGQRHSALFTRSVSQAGLHRHQANPPASGSDEQILVGCGRALVGEEIAIVDPESRRRLGPSQVGEVFASGANIAQGYWANAAASAEIFAAGIDGCERNWLRTGDLGFLDEAGELYITGRVKDIIIIRGTNHYPQDIEQTVQATDSALRRHGGAALAINDPHGVERLVIVQEVERTARHRLMQSELVRRIREAIVVAHNITADQIILIRPGTLPKTSSGKIQRSLTRQMWMQGDLIELSIRPVDQPDGCEKPQVRNGAAVAK